MTASTQPRPSPVLLDCTLRDGGYYNNWDFDLALVKAYLDAMAAANVHCVELGLRSFAAEGFKGAFAYSTDEFLRCLDLPAGPLYGVMVNASELLKHPAGLAQALGLLFAPAAQSPIGLVRIACHVNEFEPALEAVEWLKQHGYQVGFNLMQVAERSLEEIERLARVAERFKPDVLYFADSLGSLSPAQVSKIVHAMRAGWSGPLGIHTHDNRSLALANSLQALEDGVSWVDCTVTGMGRGPGNVATEYLLIELEDRLAAANVSVLLGVIAKYFQPMQQHYGWGTNPYYFLAGRHGIHPTYVQEMLTDSRYGDEDLLLVMSALKSHGGQKYNPEALESARHFYSGPAQGHWSPEKWCSGREVMVLASGPGVRRHRQALEGYIRRAKPLVIALNTQSDIAPDLIDARAASHPLRLMADLDLLLSLPQPLITPFSMLPKDVSACLGHKPVLDYGLEIEPGRFEFGATASVLPASLVTAYVIAIAAAGGASRVLMVGFDGYAGDDPRNHEMNQVLDQFQSTPGAPALLAVTPTLYKMPCSSIYAL